MAGATIWKGYIHFRDIDVAVKLHTAVREERVQFHLLHRRDNARLRQQMICALEKQPVPAEEQSKGFEVEDGKYLMVDPEELEQAAPESSRMIAIHEFVKSGEIDPLFFDRVYSLERDAADRGGNGYGALVRVLEEAGVAGICTWTMRKRSYFGALSAQGNALRLHTLRYADEVVPASSLGLRRVPVSEKELEIGSELISRMTVPFDAAKFADEHQKKLMDMIERKARGETITVTPPRRLEPTGPDRLLEALEASLKKAA